MSVEGASRRRRGRRVAAVLLGLAAALAVAEAVLRVTGAGFYAPRIDSYGFVKLDEHPDRLHWGFDPNIISWHEWDGDPYGVLPPGHRIEYDDVDDAGLRGPPAPDDGLPRVLFVGDSFTFGEGVVRSETFVQRVEDALVGSGMPVHTRNAGVPGYGTFEEWLRLPGLLDSERPTAVVVVFVPNDPIHVSDAFGRDNDLLKTGGRGGWVPRVVEVARLAVAGAARSRETEDWYLSYWFGDRRDAWATARGRLVAMRDLCRARGVRFGVAYFPLLHHVGQPPLDRIGTAFVEACAADAIPCLDLTAAFEGVPEPSLWLHPVDHHPNPRAHELAAARVAPFVQELLGAR